MSDDTQRISTTDLKLVLRNTENASRDAQAAFEATERLVIGVGARFDALEARFDALESRTSSVERRLAAVEKGLGSIEGSNHRIERMLGDIAEKLTP